MVLQKGHGKLNLKINLFLCKKLKFISNFFIISILHELFENASHLVGELFCYSDFDSIKFISLEICEPEKGLGQGIKIFT